MNLKTKIMYVYLIFIVLYAVLNAKFNQLVIDKKDWHLTQWLKVALVASVVTCFILKPRIDSINEFIKLIFVFANIYWIVFDLSLNLFRGLKWYYVGKTSWIDKHLTGWTFYIKLFMVFFSVLILMYYF